MPPSQWGGVQQLAQGLAQGLSGLSGDDEYLFLGYPDADIWLDSRISGRARRVEVSRAHGRSARRRLFDAAAARSPSLARVAGRLAGSLGRAAISTPASDGFLESLGVDVVHFVTPQAYRTRVPSLYQPLDLLHVHVPEQFTTLHRNYRETAYRTFCEQAVVVASMTAWGREDLADHFGLDRGRIAVVPLPPVNIPAGRPIEREVGGLPERYLLYPAQTWPHKNHLGLLDALALLRDRGSDVTIVCTGRKTQHFTAIARRVGELRLEGRVAFLGYVDEAELSEIYRRATGLVFPSRFEGWGLPIVEAFAGGIPVACSDIPVLREVAGAAAAYFDPDDAASMADSITRIGTDDGLRDALRRAGHERVRDLTWDRAARTYRALYRRIAGVELTDEDQRLLQPPTLVA
jgi:glycosyltransferase involved in cell wall biosynthesis